MYGAIYIYLPIKKLPTIANFCIHIINFFFKFLEHRINLKWHKNCERYHDKCTNSKTNPSTSLTHLFFGVVIKFADLPYLLVLMKPQHRHLLQHLGHFPHRQLYMPSWLLSHHPHPLCPSHYCKDLSEIENRKSIKSNKSWHT